MVGPAQVGGREFPVEERAWAKELPGRGAPASWQMAPPPMALTPPPTKFPGTPSHPHPRWPSPPQTHLPFLRVLPPVSLVPPTQRSCSHPLPLWAPARAGTSAQAPSPCATPPLPRPPPAEGRCAHRSPPQAYPRLRKRPITPGADNGPSIELREFMGSPGMKSVSVKVQIWDSSRSGGGEGTVDPPEKTAPCICFQFCFQHPRPLLSQGPWAWGQTLYL